MRRITSFWLAFFSVLLVALPLHAKPPAKPVVPPAETSQTKDVKEEPAKAEDKDEFQAALINVYANHPQLKAQREALKALDETVSQAISGFRPNVAAEYSQGRQRRDTGSGTNYEDARDKALTVTQPIFSGGETLASYTSAKDRVKAGRAQLTAVEQQVLYAAVVAYTDVVGKQSVLEVNQHNVDVLQKQLDATRARFEVGELTKTDTAQSEARLASAQANERQALGDLESARATFKRVVGYDPPPSLKLPPLPSSLPTTTTEAADWAQAAEPTLEATKHLENAAESDINIRAAAILPDVSIQGVSDRSNGGNLFGPTRVSSDAVTLNVSIPLYQSGAEWSRVREAKNQAQQAKFNTIDIRDSVIENVTRAWQDYHTAEAVIVSNEEAVKAAEVALEGIRQENVYGVRTILDVLNTEQDFFTARVNLVNARVTEKQQAYRLLAATGRLTAKDLKLPVDLNDPKQHYDKVKYKLIGF